MHYDPRFNAKMPEGWTRLAFFWRGLWLGLAVGYIFSLVISPARDVLVSVSAIVLAAFMAALASVPKAWIEQRNRLRALGDHAADSDPPEHLSKQDTT
ncbi:MAG: hypothetical protein U0836_16265 [Pirellulales bacterium]